MITWRYYLIFWIPLPPPPPHICTQTEIPNLVSFVSKIIPLQSESWTTARFLHTESMLCNTERLTNLHGILEQISSFFANIDFLPIYFIKSNWITCLCNNVSNTTRLWTICWRAWLNWPVCLERKDRIYKYMFFLYLHKDTNTVFWQYWFFCCFLSTGWSWVCVPVTSSSA